LEVFLAGLQLALLVAPGTEPVEDHGQHDDQCQRDDQLDQRESAESDTPPSPEHASGLSPSTDLHRLSSYLDPPPLAIRVFDRIRGCHGDVRQPLR
jgi:hypothetical protein